MLANKLRQAMPKIKKTQNNQQLKKVDEVKQKIEKKLINIQEKLKKSH